MGGKVPHLQLYFHLHAAWPNKNAMNLESGSEDRGGSPSFAYTAGRSWAVYMASETIASSTEEVGPDFLYDPCQALNSTILLAFQTM